MRTNPIASDGLFKERGTKVAQCVWIAISFTFVKKIFNMRNYVAIIALALLASCGGGDTKPAEEGKKDEPLAQSKNSDAFNVQFTSFLNNYYHLKDAFVLSNDDMAVASAN